MGTDAMSSPCDNTTVIGKLLPTCCCRVPGSRRNPTCPGLSACCGAGVPCGAAFCCCGGCCPGTCCCGTVAAGCRAGVTGAPPAGCCCGCAGVAAAGVTLLGAPSRPPLRKYLPRLVPP